MAGGSAGINFIEPQHTRVLQQVVSVDVIDQPRTHLLKLSNKHLTQFIYIDECHTSLGEPLSTTYRKSYQYSVLAFDTYGFSS